MSILLCDALEVATSEDFADARRLPVTGVLGSDTVLCGENPFRRARALWVRLAPHERGHPWREPWIVQVHIDGTPADAAVILSPDSPRARLVTRRRGAVRVWPLVAPRFARAEPLPMCRAVPVRDVAFSRHTRQSSVSPDAGSVIGAWMTPTMVEPRPWWEIDTGASHYIDRIRVHVAGRLAGATGAGELTVQVFAYLAPDGTPAAPWRATLSELDRSERAGNGGGQVIEVGRVGRHVRVETRSRDGRDLSLHLAGIEILAAPVAIESLLDNLCQTFTLFADRPLFSHRQVSSDGDGDPGGRSDGYDRWLTYREVWQRAMNLSSGLARRLEGDAPAPASPGGADGHRVFVGICASGRAEWPIADIACVQRGHVVVPLAHTDAPDKWRHIVEQCDMQVVICSHSLVPAFAALAARCSSLRLIVGMTPLPGEPRSHEHTPGDPGSVVDLAELERLGASAAPIPFVRRHGRELYTVLYTSGSTGRPKGAMRSHDAFNAMIAGYGVVQPAVHLSFQPFSHLSERMMIPVIVQHGGQVGFSCGDPARLFEDISLLRPTFIGGVPRVFDVLRAQYHEALAARRQSHPEEDEEVARGEVLAAIRELFGDRLQTVSVGSAKPSAALLAFLRRCFAGCWVTEGYGSTEVGTIAIDGVVQPDVDVKLVDVPELGYLSTDDPPRGEICVRTRHMISGYLGDEQASVEQFDDQGYFRTGDIGQRNRDGTIHIIGRRKNVVKLTQGEFVAPEVIETALLRCPLVDQIFVHASPLEACVVAVVIVNRAALRRRLEPAGAGQTPGETDAGADREPDDGYRSDTARALVRGALREIGQGAGLASFEIPAAVHLDIAPMTVEAGLLTSSNKPDRRAMERHYRAALDELYQRVGGTGGGAGSLLEAVESVAAAVIGEVDVTADLTGELGVDSLAGVQLVSMLQERLHREIPLQAWFGASSLEEFARRLEGGGESSSEPVRGDLARPLPFTADSLREVSRATGSHAMGTEIRHVLLTGATGFLGRGLLEALLDRTSATIHCLVRAGSSEAGQRRLREQLVAGGVAWTDERASRIRAVPGDLAEPSLGLPADDWAELASTIDVIVHAGAVVNWLMLYGQLRRPNVLGTMELMRLAVSRRVKPFHFVSTISTAPADGDEDAILSMEQAMSGSGYGLSKWIAEKHVRDAAAIGLPVAIYRPAMIAGHSVRGHGNPDDFITRYLVGSAQLGLHLDLDVVLDMTPVDFVSEAIVTLLCRAALAARTYHLVNVEHSMSYRDLGQAMRACGLPVQPAPYGGFRDALLSIARQDDRGDNALLPLLSYFPSSGFSLTMGPWPSTRTGAELAALGVSCPAIDETIIAAYLRSLTERGLLD